jgi:hypothetical protein
MESLPGWQRGQFLDWKGGDKKTVCSALSVPCGLVFLTAEAQR